MISRSTALINDARYRPIKVQKDLEHFREYINKSIENLKALENIGAECREVKPRIIIEPKGQVIRLKEIQALRIKLPSESSYYIKWNNDEYGYFDKFDGLYNKRICILEKNKHIAFYNDYVIFEYSSELDVSKKYALYNEDGDVYNCTVNKLDFSNIEAYPI